jgi:hypothetical protein
MEVLRRLLKLFQEAVEHLLLTTLRFDDGPTSNQPMNIDRNRKKKQEESKKTSWSVSAHHEFKCSRKQTADGFSNDKQPSSSP